MKSFSDLSCECSSGDIVARSKQEILLVYLVVISGGSVLANVDLIYLASRQGEYISQFIFNIVFTFVFALSLRFVLLDFCSRKLFVFSHKKMKREKILFFHVFSKRFFNWFSRGISSLFGVIEQVCIRCASDYPQLKRFALVVFFSAGWIASKVLVPNIFSQVEVVQWAIGSVFTILCFLLIDVLVDFFDPIHCRVKGNSVRGSVNSSWSVVLEATRYDYGVLGRAFGVVLVLSLVKCFYFFVDFCMSINWLRKIFVLLESGLDFLLKVIRKLVNSLVRCISVVFELALGIAFVWFLKSSLEFLLIGDLERALDFVLYCLAVNFVSCCLRITNYRLSSQRELFEKKEVKRRPIGLLLSGGGQS